MRAGATAKGVSDPTARSRTSGLIASFSVTSSAIRSLFCRCFGVSRFFQVPGDLFHAAPIFRLN